MNRNSIFSDAFWNLAAKNSDQAATNVQDEAVQSVFDRECVPSADMPAQRSTEAKIQSQEERKEINNQSGTFQQPNNDAVTILSSIVGEDEELGSHMSNLSIETQQQFNVGAINNPEDGNGDEDDDSDHA